MSESESIISLKFANATVDNFNLILSNNQIEQKFDFETISRVYDKLLLKIGVILDKTSAEYDKGKKKFSKFLNYNYKFIKHHLELDESILQLFKDSANHNWYLLHLSIVSYLSYLKQTNKNTEINLKGMIDKLMIEIEEYSNSETEQEAEQTPEINTQSMIATLSKHIPQTGNAPTLMKGLIGDIKNILTDNDGLESKNILDISKDLSQKYQNMIEKGDVNMGDLLSGVLGILNDPDSLNGEFDDIDTSKLPDPNNILADMANDPKLKEVMGMVSNNNDMGMFGSMMANMMNSSQTDNKSIHDLEREIEQMMREVQEVEINTNTDTDTDTEPTEAEISVD